MTRHTACIHTDPVETVQAANQLRSSRILLGVLYEDENSIQAVFDEFNNCPDCLRFVARTLASFGAQALANHTGTERAKQIIEQILIEDTTPRPTD